MKQVLFILATLLFSTICFSQKKSHPYYGGGHHTTSHGGSYPGSINSHHKGGHYVNPNTNNTYGRHKRRKG
jgi:hypothetical protein